MDDFLANLLEIGSAKGGWRSVWAIVGLAIGGALGVYLGWTNGGLVAAASSGLIGGFLGWIAFILLMGIRRFLVVFLVVLAIVLGWYWLTGTL